MAARPDLTPGNLSFRLIGDVLSGASPGKQIHTLTRSGTGGAARPPAGKYQILAPILHPSLGRVAVVVPLQGSIYALTKLPPAAVNVPSRYTLHPGAAATPAAGFVGFTTDAGGTPAGPSFGATTGGSVVGPGAAKGGNSLGVTTGVAPGAGAASFSPHQGFILSKDNVTAPNAVAVLSGFDELMDALESSGGAILEILG